MRPREVVTPLTLSLWLTPQPSGPALRTGRAELRFGDAPEVYFITQGKHLVAATLRASRQGQVLDAYLGSGRATLTSIDQVSKDGTAVLLTVRFFNGRIVEMGDVEVGIDDRVHASAKRLLKTGDVSVGAVGRFLTELCVLEPEPGSDVGFFLMTTGPATDSEFETAPGAGDANAPSVVVSGAERAFCIHGKGLRIAVARKSVGPDEAKYLAIRINGMLGGDPDGAVRLARGRLTFTDFTRAGAVQALAAGTMARLREGQNGYLKKWDEYGEIEGDLLLARARKVGALRWTAADYRSRGEPGVKLFLAEPLPELLGIDDTLEIVDKMPVHLERPDMTWKEYLAQVEKESEAQRLRQELRDAGGQQPEENNTVGLVADVLDVSEQSIVLDLPVPPDREGLFLVLSLSGERTQIERRMEARRRVLEGRSANPMLGLLIEERGEPPEPVRPQKLKPLTAFVREKVFPKRPPTLMQEKAIRIALNTPDIALIQGPPGTGKTTVIAAIVERLNELADKGEEIQGEVLISAFQHDAIENMMARLAVNSLPVPKFGRRSGESGPDDRNAEQTRRWCSELAARLRAQNPGLGAPEQLLDAKRRCHEYLLAPSLDNAVATIRAFLQVPEGHLPQKLVERARVLEERLCQERDGNQAQGELELLRSVWSLRTSAEALQDDGPAMAQNLLDRCGEQLLPGERKLLEQVAAWRSEEPPPFLPELRGLKATLQERYRQRATFRLDKPRAEVLELVEEAARALETGIGASRRDRILAEFLLELESHPAAVHRAVEEYGFVFAATCQQSKGRAITRRKLKMAEGKRSVDYDTVIIDEAARSSPRDLLIPMAQARRRIILVGDHRQLPHMINEEIARTLEARNGGSGERAASQEDSYVRRSMFQYLLSRLDQLKARDGFQRWVTLDQQFRMHPLLGNFVSDYFYRVHDAREAFASPLPADGFVHDLPGIAPVPAVWIDVPARHGEELRSGTSWKRGAEAREIRRRLKAWIDSPKGRRLTYGVISFYKPQVNEVFQALSDADLTVRDGPSGQWRIADSYTLRPAEEELPAEERLRIGTVDSFQGMEFDVVFLSMVRSRRKLPGVPADLAELARLERSVYGHLTSPNRLCVSMSRQKRLLVVVGDKALVEHELARQAVPGLVGFLELCKAHGAVLSGGDADE